jgi:hypothetical protein
LHRILDENEKVSLSIRFVHKAILFLSLGGGQLAATVAHCTITVPSGWVSDEKRARGAMMNNRAIFVLMFFRPVLSWVFV